MKHIFKIYLAFHLEANSPKSINNVSNKIKKILTNELNLTAVNIIKDNTFYIEKEFDEWENCIYYIIELSQNIGREWIITGTINYEINLWTNKPTIDGVKAIEINCDNNIK
jgi:hypothetical protein